MLTFIFAGELVVQIIQQVVIIDQNSIPNRDKIIKEISPSSNTETAVFKLYGYKNLNTTSSIGTFVQNFSLKTGIPSLNAFIAGLTGAGGLNQGFTETQKNAESFGKAIGVVSGIISGFITFLREAIGLVVSLANELIRVVNIIPGVNIGSLPNPAPSAGRSSLPSVPSGGSTFGGRGMGQINNITVNAIDGEGAARAVAKVVNQSAARSVPLFTGNGIRLQ